MSDAFEPKILAFLCNWCAYAGADLAGVSRLQYPPNLRPIRTMCSGRVDPVYLVEGLSNGFDCVTVFGCHIGDCHYLDGNLFAEKRFRVVQELLDLTGIGRDRVALRWVSAAEGQRFAQYASELTEAARQLGRFDPAAFRLPLGAAQQALTSQRLRWLTGMERKLLETGNVYGEKLEADNYHALLSNAVAEEYQKALISKTLFFDGPQSVREISDTTGLPVFTVSLRLNDLERTGQAELQRFEGTTPKFIGLTG